MSAAAETAAEAAASGDQAALQQPEMVAALIFVLPFVCVYAVLFIYPTLQMVWLSLHKAPLIGPGTFIGIDNYVKLFKDRLFGVAFWNTVYFVAPDRRPGDADRPCSSPWASTG